MGYNKNVNTNKNRRPDKREMNMTTLIIIVTVFLFISFVVSLSQFGDREDDASQNESEQVSQVVSEDSIVEDISVSTPDTDKKDYKYYDDIKLEQCAFSNTDVINGNLAVINGEYGDYPTIPESDPLVSIYQNKTGSYGLSGTSLTLRKTAMSNFDRFIMSFYSAFPSNGLGVERGYVSPDNVGTDSLSVELTSGNSLKFAIYGASASLSGDDYNYLKEQAYRYGIIQRYPEGKEVNTGFEANLAIYRHVGVVHSCYMNHYNLCLEEYIDKIRTEKVIEYENSLENGAKYVICYVEKDTSSDITYLPVPSDTNYIYTVSGDGSDGFIVTIKLP